MLTHKRLFELLHRPETSYVDFKGGEYDLSLPRGVKGKGYLDLIKDILCMSNTPRQESAFIITGIVNRPGSQNRAVGIKTSTDDNDIQNLLRRWIYPIPSLTYYQTRYKQKNIGVFEIPIDRLTGPYYIRADLSTKDARILKSMGKFLFQDKLYFRQGTTNRCAQPADRTHIIEWFQTYREDRWQDWGEFKERCDNFDERRHFILVTSPLSHMDQSVLESFSHVNWSAVIDFDTSSDEKGLLKAIGSKSVERNIIRSVRGDFRSFNAWHNIYWFSARGLNGLTQTLVKGGGWRQWRSVYSSELDSQFKHMARFLLPDPITFVIIWNDDSLLRHLRTTLEATTVFEDAKYVVVSETTSRVSSVIDEDYDPSFFDIPVAQLASGLSVEFPSHTIPSEEYTLPSKSGAPILVPNSQIAWLQSHLDLIHLGIGIESPQLDESEEAQSEFLRGGIVTWRELELRRDAERDVTDDIVRRAKADLDKRNTIRIDLFHVPGAGGTTVSRRVVWDLHRQFPCVVIGSGDSHGIAERIAYVSSVTGQYVLALVDSANVAEREIEDLYRLLQSRNIGCVLLGVSRRHSLPKPGRRVFNLQLRLSQKELPRFVDKFANLVPERSRAIKAINTGGSGEKQTAFYFGLTTYGEEYRGLKTYVSSRISGLAESQLDLLVHLSIAYMYGQKGIGAQMFQNLLGLSNRDVSFPLVFAGQLSVLDILIEDNKSREWRPIHQIVAKEVLQQILTPLGADPRVWNQALSTWGKKFIKFCSSEYLVASERALELLRRVFIYRYGEDALGRETGDDSRSESSRLEKFSLFIQQIPSREGRLEVFQFLAESFPVEAHFWAHLGRFLSKIMNNHDEALSAVEQAISLQPNDPLLLHMKGICYRDQAYYLMSSSESLESVVALSERASDCFKEARSLNPDHEHAYISEIQLLARVLNYAVRDTEESIFQYIKRHNAIPYIREAFDNAESLLAEVGASREGTQSSSWEQSCRASISRLYGGYQEALQIWDSLLSRDDIFRPPVRRQIVYAMKDRGKTWANMSQSNLSRCISLLQDNLDEHPNNERDLRLWLRAVRHATLKPSIDSLIEKVSYWKTNTNALEATYYLYVLYALKALDGLSAERDLADRFMNESVQLSRTRRNRRHSFEWLGEGNEISRLVHQSVLGNWNQERNFWPNTSALKRVEGMIVKYRGPQAGEIEISGLSCFFVPNYNPKQPISEEDINRRVNFYLGFSYSGIRAWDVAFS